MTHITYKPRMNQLFCVLSLPVNSTLLVVKFWGGGESKAARGFLTARGAEPLTPVVRGSGVIIYCGSFTTHGSHLHYVKHAKCGFKTFCSVSILLHFVSKPRVLVIS